MYNYTWDKHAPGDYSQFGENKIPARIPISALVAGIVERKYNVPGYSVIADTF